MKDFFRKILHYLKLFVIAFLLSSAFIVILYRFIPPPCTPLMLIRMMEQIGTSKEIKLRKDWVALKDISSYLPVAVIASEDQKFVKHHGFDWESIRRAYELNKRKSRKGKVIGGSTISQQVAKNVFLWPSRSFIRKGLEVYFTVLIEFFWSKERIMEVYLNVIEMGDGIYGAEMAAKIYFNKSAKKLNLDQAAALAAILPNPRKYSVKNPSSYVDKRKRWIKRNMQQLGKIEL